MSLTQRTFSQDATASAALVTTAGDRLIGLKGGANRLYTVAQLHTLESFDVAGVPDATTQARRLIWVTDGDAGSACLAVSDGSTWRRVALGATISAT